MTTIEIKNIFTDAGLKETVALRRASIVRLILDFQKTGAEFYMSNNKIAESINSSARTVSDDITWLTEAGVITKEKKGATRCLTVNEAKMKSFNASYYNDIKDWAFDQDDYNEVMEAINAIPYTRDEYMEMSEEEIISNFHLNAITLDPENELYRPFSQSHLSLLEQIIINEWVKQHYTRIQIRYRDKNGNRQVKRILPDEYNRVMREKGYQFDLKTCKVVKLEPAATL